MSYFEKIDGYNRICTCYQCGTKFKSKKDTSVCEKCVKKQNK